MKKVIGIYLIFLLISCEQIDYDSYHNESDHAFLEPGSISTSELVDIMTQAEGWVVSHFIEDNRDISSLLTSYVFVFHTDGRVSAQSNNETTTGFYSVFRDDGKVELLMSFPDNINFQELNDDWYYYETDAESITFADGDDVIKFQQRR